MEIIYRRLEDLRPNPKNPRKTTPGAIEQLAQSIKDNPEFFEARPILLSDRTGELVIIAGERRSEAAILLGLEKVPTILLQGLTEEKEDEIMVRDNTHSGLWDDAKLARIAEEWGVLNVCGWGPDLNWVQFTPNVKPDEGAHIVTDDDIRKAEGDIEREVGKMEETYYTVCCPDCGKQFKIKL